VSINGTPPSELGFSFDGVDNSGHGEIFGAGPISMGPNPDAVSEFSVLTHTAKAEAGRDPVLVHIRTKGGSNEWHGQVRGLYLDPTLVARDFFDVFGQPETATKVIGGQFSGPLTLPRLYQARDKTFFLVDVEQIWKSVGQTNTLFVPSQAERNGDFSDRPPDFWPVDPMTGESFPDGRITESRISPQAAFYRDELIPPANQGDSEFVYPSESKNDSFQFTTRLDHQFSPSDSLSGSFFFRAGSGDGPWTTPDASVVVDDRWRNLSIQYVHSFSAASVNALTFGESHGLHDQVSLSPLRGTDASDLGFNLVRKPSESGSLPVISLPGFPTLDPGQINDRFSDQTFTLRDVLSWIRGAHSLKIGFDIRWLRNTSQNANGYPFYQFAGWNPFGSGDTFADFLLGVPFWFRQWEDSIVEPRQTLGSVFVQDDYRVKPNLTLNLGLRYDLSGPWKTATGRNAVFRAAEQSKVFPEAPAGLLYPADSDPWTGKQVDDQITPGDYNNLAPRIGLAYSPGNSQGFISKLSGGPGRSSIRVGYGLFYMQSSPQMALSMCCLSPWTFEASRRSPTLQEAGASFADPWGADDNPFRIPVEERGFPEDRIPAQLVESGFSDPLQHQWSVSFQRQLDWGMTLEASYIGNTARNLIRRFEGNQALLTPDAKLGNVEQRQEFQDFSSISGFASDGKSNHHSLQLITSRRFASGVQFNANYVWSKTLSDADVFREIATYARANIDRRHTFAGTFLWEIPGTYQSSLTRILLKGWRMTAILRFATGPPIDIRNPVDSTLRGVKAGMPDIEGTFKPLDPREVNTFIMPNGRSVTGNFYFDPTIFLPVSPESVDDARAGTLGRNVFSAPGINNVDFSLGKIFFLDERHRIHLRMDVTNLFNHAQFNLPASQTVNFRGSRFQIGRLTRTYGARRIQFYLKYSF
jgi:hypothetical protein